MEFHHSTILITGGSSGIGFQLAKVLLSQGNKILICGRSHEKLEEAKQLLPALHTFQSDLSRTTECIKLFTWITEQHPECNVLINNAALVHKTDFRTDESAIEKAQLEIQTNLVAPIMLCKLFLPLLERNKGTVINITTGLVYAPRAVYPFYNATKSGLHAFTQVLRFQLKAVPVKVIEVMMPVVNTPWHKGEVPRIAISPEEAVTGMLAGIKKGKAEIHVGKVWILRLLSRIAPGFAFKKINDVR